MIYLKDIFKKYLYFKEQDMRKTAKQNILYVIAGMSARRKLFRLM